MLQKPSDEGMPIFDTVQGRMIGRIVEETATAIIVDCIGILRMHPEPAENGKKAKILVGIHHESLTPQRYHLERMGLRGRFYLYNEWLFDLYNEYVENMRSGKYELDVCIPAVETTVELRGSLDTQTPEKAVALVGLEDTKAL